MGGGDALSQYTIDLQLGEGVDKAAPGHVHQKIEMTEEISTKDGVSDICDEKIPSKGLPESQVEGVGCCTEGHNAGIVDRLGWRTCREGGTG